ncbi:jg6263, partial [Pararge aegeria aegeria]
KRYKITPKVAVTRTKDEYLPLERLWAYLTIKQLLDKRDAGEDHSTDKKGPGKKALDIALKYAFVTPLTSLVVVKPNETNTADVQPADKPSLPSRPSSLLTPFTQKPWRSASPRRNLGFFKLHSDYSFYRRKSALHFHDSVANIVAPAITTSKTTTGTQAPTTASNVNYHLDGFEWTSSMLNSSTGALTVLGENGTQVILQLTTDVDPPKMQGGDGECLNSTSTSAVGANENAGSVCVYLTRCYAARSITADDYKKSYCIVNNGYAGVCCAKDEVDRIP